MARVTRYMLDTNTISQLLKAHPRVSSRVTATAMTSLRMSAITQGELLFGLAKRPGATRLHRKRPVCHAVGLARGLLAAQAASR